MIESVAMRRTAILTAVSAFVALTASSPAPGQAWWNIRYRHRREVTIDAFRPDRVPGKPLAVVTMPTAGLVAGEGENVRVTTSSGVQMPSRVLMTGPGDRVRVAFEARPGVTKYHVYFDAEKPAPAEELEIRRGVLLEMWEYPGGPIGTLEQVRKVFDKADKLVGRDFRDRIFLGYNPFGPENRVASVFTGWLACEKAGNYTFSTSSQDASFLLVDDQLVVDNGGFHPPQRDIRKQGRIELDRGMHKMTFYHVCGGGNPIAVVAWKPPGEGKVTPIPPRVFPEVHRGKPGPLEQYARPVTIDFIPEHLGELFMIDRYYQRYGFEALTEGRGGRSIEWEWDFGDGQRSGAARAEHVYLLPGEYTVTLAARRTVAGELKRTNRIFVSRMWDEVTGNRMDSVRQHAEIVAGYQFSELASEAIMHAVELLNRAGDRTAIIRAGDALVERSEAPADVLERAMPLYADALIASDRSRRAVDVLLKAAEMTEAPAVAAGLVTRAGRVALDELNDDEQALKLFTRVVEKYGPLTTSGHIRDARIGVGDVGRRRGDYDKAKAAYEKARIRRKGSAGTIGFIRGDFVRHVEDYIRTGDFEDARTFLNRWADTLPADKLDGFWSLKRVQLATAQKRYREAIAEAETLVDVNPSSNHAPGLLMLAVQAHRRLNEKAPAVEKLKRLAENYPESPLARAAAEMLDDE